MFGDETPKTAKDGEIQNLINRQLNPHSWLFETVSRRKNRYKTLGRVKPASGT
jgi:hypothetical protein